DIRLMVCYGDSRPGIAPGPERVICRFHRHQEVQAFLSLFEKEWILTKMLIQGTINPDPSAIVPGAFIGTYVSTVSSDMAHKTTVLRIVHLFLHIRQEIFKQVFLIQFQ